MAIAIDTKRSAPPRTARLPQLVGNTYYRLRGDAVSLDSLDREERTLIDQLIRNYLKQPASHEFHNEWVRAVEKLYDDRGVPWRESVRAPLYRVAMDLESRLGILHGHIRAGSDYRDDLSILIVSHFKSRRAFCEATGLSEDMLSHVLARRKHLSIQKLTEALERIGYTLQIRPTGDVAAEEHRKSLKGGKNGKS